MTTAKLREMAHTLGVTTADLALFANSRGVTIDDTPADETEHDMDKMTITHEQLKQAALIVVCTPLELQIGLEHIGFSIAPAEPPAEMVKLAREIADSVPVTSAMTEDETYIARAAALAALQHVVGVADSLPTYTNHEGSTTITLGDLDRALGAA